MRIHLLALALPLALLACSGTTTSGFQTTQADSGLGFNPGQGTGPGSSGTGTGPVLTGGDSGGGGSGTGATVTTIYADTDTALYSLDPATNQVTMIGPFAGFSGSSGDDGATDVAVNAEGDIYINSESAIYKATLPAGGTGTVNLTMIATIALQSNHFYALGFAPPGVLGAGETLVGGDNNGELWSIDPSTGSTRDLGNFGPDPSDSSHILGCSGDIVFYTNASGVATGLATIRSCKSSGSSCTTSDDYLAAIDMAALTAAYTGSPASSLLGGLYGAAGQGTGYGELFGLGAWEGTVFGFGHSTGDLVTISTPGGAGNLVTSMSGTSWAGAGVSTKTTITVAAPPTAK